MKKMLLPVALALAACGGHGVHESTVPRAAHEFSGVDAIAQRFIDDEWASGIAVALVQGEDIEIRGYGKVTEDGAVPDAHLRSSQAQ